MTTPKPCESGACFTVTEHEGTATIHGALLAGPGEARDTVEAFAKFRDAIKAGDYDHIGQEQT